MTDARLDEFDKEEWRVVVKRLRPDVTDEDFDAAWKAFEAMKRERERQLGLH